jgi:mRNA interferase RelE/StbE
MKYEVMWQDEALQDLLALPSSTATAITKQMETYVAQNPRQLGQPLSGQFSGLYRYRYTNYRIIYEIIDHELRIYVVRIGHRKDIYER